jgi:hypothetical protein
MGSLSNVPGTLTLRPIAASLSNPTYGSITTGDFNPAFELFGNGEQGLWYDLNDDSTIFQDSAGTTLASWGDPVGRVNDKSGNGNNAVQSTAGSRPIRGRMPKAGVRNLLTATATLATQNVTTTNVQHTLSFTGTGTVTLSGTSTAGPLVGTGVNDRVSLTFTPTAGTLTLTVTGSVTLAQLQTGAAFDAYQAVGLTRFDITESGQPSCGYLSFNGSNQWMQTAAAVNFSSTDEMSVFAGVRKVSDAAIGFVIEHTTSRAANNGAFTLAHGADAGFGYSSKGTVSATAEVVSGITAPTNRVFTALSDISADSIVFRANGAQIATSAGDQGTGNYANAVVYFGARAGSSLFFNGLVFSTIIRGASTSGTLLTRTEQYVARQTPAVNL